MLIHKTAISTSQATGFVSILLPQWTQNPWLAKILQYKKYNFLNVPPLWLPCSDIIYLIKRGGGWVKTTENILKITFCWVGDTIGIKEHILMYKLKKNIDCNKKEKQSLPAPFNPAASCLFDTSHYHKATPLWHMLHVIPWLYRVRVGCLCNFAHIT